MDGEELVLQQAGLRLDTEKNLISESIPENHIDVLQDSFLQNSTSF